jgi:hypothetical protein
MNTFAGETYLIKHLGLNNSPVILHKSKAQTTNPRGAVRVAGAVRGTAVYGAEYWTAIGRSDIQFSYHTHTENIKHFDYRPVSEFTVRMLAGWAVETCHLPRNLAHEHPSPS